MSRINWAKAVLKPESVKARILGPRIGKPSYDWELRYQGRNVWDLHLYDAANNRWVGGLGVHFKCAGKYPCAEQTFFDEIGISPFESWDYDASRAPGQYRDRCKYCQDQTTAPPSPL